MSEFNSDIANHITNGTYFRQDMTLYTDDAYLWRANWQNKVEIALNMLRENTNSDFICRVTGLSLDEVEKLRKGL